ncbi:MAG: OmpA family protein, partial [Gemmatimonadota bacterium]
IKDAARRAVEDEATRKIQTVIGEAIACSLGDAACVEEARKNGEPVVIVDEDGEVISDENGQPVTSQEDAAAAMEEPGEGRWANYDFLRGERPIYNSRWNVEDLENPPAMKPNPAVRVGRIPGNVEFVSGNMEIVQTDGLNAVEFKDQTYFRIPLSEPLPEDFSLEFTLKAAVGVQYLYVYFEPFQGQNIDLSTWENHYLTLWNSSGVMLAGNRVSGTDTNVGFVQQLTPVKFQVDGGYAILYVAGERIAQVSNFKHTVGSTAIEFEVHGRTDIPMYIRDIRVDYGVEDPVSVFEAEGEYTTRSIYFDFNSADLRPESTPELERLRAMIAEYGQPLVIEGHTDSTGADDYNLELSEGRATSVKTYLVDHGIEAGLIEVVGKGETEPIADNGTDDGRAANRRVVVKRAGA